MKYKEEYNENHIKPNIKVSSRRLGYVITPNKTQRGKTLDLTAETRASKNYFRIP